MITFRPAKRENTPLIIGLAGPTKSGKTYSALRLATGLAGNGPVVMLNTEGQRGHLYADTFKYQTADLVPPYRPQAFIEGFQAAAAIKPAVVILDSTSAMHDGPGGILEWHEEKLDRIAGNDYKKRERSTFSAWIEPKMAENQFIYQMLSMAVPVILCIRAKEKALLKKGQEPVFKWSPILGDAISFETIFTLMFLPGARGVPTLELSDLRTPFDDMITPGRQVDESLGQALAAWARGGTTAGVSAPKSSAESPMVPGATSGGGPGGIPPSMTPLDDLVAALQRVGTKEERTSVWRHATEGDAALWPSLTADEQKRALIANGKAKQRVGG